MRALKVSTDIRVESWAAVEESCCTWRARSHGNDKLLTAQQSTSKLLVGGVVVCSHSVDDGTTLSHARRCSTASRCGRAASVQLATREIDVAEAPEPPITITAHVHLPTTGNSFAT